MPTALALLSFRGVFLWLLFFFIRSTGKLVVAPLMTVDLRLVVFAVATFLTVSKKKAGMVTVIDLILQLLKGIFFERTWTAIGDKPHLSASPCCFWLHARMSETEQSGFVAVDCDAECSIKTTQEPSPGSLSVPGVSRCSFRAPQPCKKWAAGSFGTKALQQNSSR